MANAAAPEKANPIYFNPDGMTVRQLKHIADTMRGIFDGLARPDVDNSNVIFHLEQAREWMLREWGPAP